MTELTARQILMVVLCFVILFGGMMGTVFILIPTTNDPVGSRNWAIAFIAAAVLATIWFVKLCLDAVRDRRRGVTRGPAKVGGRFHIGFGLIAAAGGVACSLLTLDAARMAGGGVWTFYYGMIGWGVLQMIYGWTVLRREREEAQP